MAGFCIRDQKSRWGSCSRQGRIALNFRLVQMPPFVSDYVLLHELMHLNSRIIHGGSGGWSNWRVRGYRAAERWLKTEGRSLVLGTGQQPDCFLVSAYDAARRHTVAQFDRGGWPTPTPLSATRTMQTSRGSCAIDFRTRTRAPTRRRFSRSPPRMRPHLAIEVDGEAAGAIGYVSAPMSNGYSAEIGYWLGEAHWGRGIATEALALVTDHVFTTRISCGSLRCPLPTISASIRVLEKAGYVREAILRSSSVKYGMPRDQALVRARQCRLEGGHVGSMCSFSGCAALEAGHCPAGRMRHHF